MDSQQIDEPMDFVPQPKRFKHKSYNQTLKDVHLPSTFQQTHLDHEVEDNDSHFHEALDHWRQLNLAPSFIQFAKKADGLSASMPLLLHNWREIYELWLEAFKSADDEGLRALLDLLQKMTHDLRTTVSPVYSSLLQNLLGLLPRSISAPALTCLLETLSSLFRYLLIPAVDHILLEETWTAICSVLPKCLGEIQRAVAEVWGGVMRRLKTGPREKAVLLMAETVGDVEDASAWVVVYACKSVSQTLHTCTPSIFAPLLSYHVSVAFDSRATHRLLRRALTALIHHVKNADQFSLLGELIVQHLSSVAKETDSSKQEDVECLRRMLEVTSVVIGVRQGSRLTDTQKLTLFTELNILPIVPQLHTSLLLFTASLFTGAEMPLWLGPGLKFLQKIWNTPAVEPQMPFSQNLLSFTLKLHLCLADSGWGGWKLIASPLILKSTVKPELGLMEHYQRELVAFLAALKRGKKLGGGDGNGDGVDAVWKRKIEAIIVARIKGGGWRDGVGEDVVAELDDILTLSSFFSSAITTLLVDVITSTMNSSDGENGGKGKSEYSAQILGLSMQTLARRECSEWAGKVNIALWTSKCTEKWAWSYEVLEGLVALAQASPSTKSTPVSKIYPSLYASLISHSRPLRLASLRLLDSKLIDPQHDQIEVLKRCLQGEEVPLDIQGVRERVLRIGRVVQVVGDEKGADLCARWLVAQLKVNLRPLWSPAMAAIGVLGGRFGDLVWRLLLEEVKGVTSGMNATTADSSSSEVDEEEAETSFEREQEGDDDDDKDPWEEERTWRDPSAHKMRSVVVVWDDPEGERNRLRKEQASQERFDIQSYEHQLLATLGECCSLVEKHNRELIPLFLSLNGQDEDPNAHSKLSKTKLVSWLKLFSKFSNPKALYSTEVLKTLYTTLLSHSDRQLQNVALSCLFAYKSPTLTPYEEPIRALLDDTRWRDELSLLDMDNIPESSRPEVLDVIIRLLFGVMLERKGRGRGGGGGGADRRAAVLSAFAGCTDRELGLLVDLMLRPFGWDRTSGAFISQEGGDEPMFQVSHVEMGEPGRGHGVSDKQIVGFLTLLADVLKNLGSRLVGYWPALLGMTVNLVAAAQGRIGGTAEVVVEQIVAEGETAEEEEIENVEDVQAVDLSTASSRVVRSIRQLGLKRFADFFRIPVIFDFTPYMRSAFASFITPRLPILDRENTQAPSALLELFHVWTVDGIHVPFLVDFDTETLPKIYDCLVATNVKPSVISRIFDIVDNILRSSAEDEYVSEHVLKPYVSRLLSNLSTLVERTKGVSSLATPIGQRQITILSEIAQYSTDAEQASTLLALFNPLLRRPAKLVPEKIKAGLVKIIGDLMRLIPDLSDSKSTTYQKTYGLLSQLFQSLRSRPARLSLVSTFLRFADIDGSLLELANLLESMNAYSVKRLDEPDFDRRLSAFTELNESLYNTLSSSAWLPVLYNMLNFIQDADELAVRNSAAHAMRRFIDFVAAQTSPDYDRAFLTILYPGLKNGLRSKNEMVRVEVLGVIAYSVEKCEHIASLQEMRTLLEGGDEEANFFNNILHIQLHRRSRALRRLADHCDEGDLRSSTIADIFVPLVSNYIISTASVDHHLVNDAILATGRMAKQLSWGPYYALVQKYLKLSRAKDESERVYVRALVALLDNFHFPMDEVLSATETVENPIADGDDVDDEDVTEIPIQEPAKPSNIARIADAVNLRLLPNLLNHLEKHDANTDDNTRIPIAVGVVTVAKHLPAAAREVQITRLLTILSQILRSKSQETRDLTRDSLNRIAVSLGPSYLPILLRELRAALLRGPQLHVLAYAVHSLVIHVTTGEHATAFATLDDCVNDVAHVSAEVIFGESGKDVQAEDFKTKMREVRASSSRGLDSFAIMAKHITPSKISSLLVPIKAIMHETEASKVMTLVDEVLKRITIGLNGNQHLVPTELLTLCNTLVSQNAVFLQQTPARRKKNLKSDIAVQVKRQATAETNHYANNSFRFVTFGLEILNTALKRNRFNFQDAATMSRLESMMVVVGNTLYSTHASVLILGMRCAAGLVKCPLKAVEKSLPVIVRQILDIIKQAGNTESELVQVAFKSLATILRDGPPVQVKEKDLVYLIELLSPDLEEPSRQASVFTLLRAIVARKFVVPEIYDLMEKVSEVSVTSQSPQVQELCRGVLLQFLLDYPQGKGRLRNQMAFFAKNLSYIHETGRLSIMELLSAIVIKFQATLIQEYADLLFVSLVMVVANDDSAKCREMGAQLIKNLWIRLDEERRNVLLSHLHSWMNQDVQPLLTWVSAQIYGFVVDVAQTDASSYVSDIIDDLMTSLRHSSASFTIVDEDDDNSPMEVEMAWQLPYHSLTSVAKILRLFPTLAMQDDKIGWSFVTDHLLFPHAWARTAACRLLGLLFNAVPVALPRLDCPDDHPLSSAGMREVARKLTQQLKSEHLDDALSLQVVKNLFYIGKCFYLVPSGDPSAVDENAEDILDGEAAAIQEDTLPKVDEDKLKALHNPLPWLFSKLSYQIKSGHIARRSRAATKPNWSQQPLAGLRWFAAMSSHMDAVRLEQFLVHILTPVYRLTEDDTIRDTQMDELKATAVELQDLIQAKVGTTKFSNIYSQIRQSALGVRRERKVAKVLQATTNPEAAAKRKMQRNVIKKDSRKRKERGFLDGKGKFKRRREE